MSEVARRLREIVIEGVLDGPGVASRAARRAAFENQAGAGVAADLVDKVVRHAWKVTDEDVAAAKVAGVPEDEIFELTVCAALGASTRQLRSALAALDAATAAGSASAAAPARVGAPAAQHDGRNP